MSTPARRTRAPAVGSTDGPLIQEGASLSQSAWSGAPDFNDRLRAVVGASAVITDPADMDAYMSEPRDLYHGRALAIVKPSDATKVANVLALCNAQGVAVVPQGGN